MAKDAVGAGAEAAVETTQMSGVRKECRGCSEGMATDTVRVGVEDTVETKQPIGVRGEF